MAHFLERVVSLDVVAFWEPVVSLDVYLVESALFFVSLYLNM